MNSLILHLRCILVLLLLVVATPLVWAQGSQTVQTLRFIHPNTPANGISLIPPTGITTYSLTLPASQGASNQVLINDGNGVLAWSTALTTSSGWSLSGNSITSSGGALGAAPTGSWLGTSNAQDLRLATNSVTRMIVTSAGAISMGSTLDVTGATTLSGGATVTGTLTTQTSTGTQDQLVLQAAATGTVRFAGTITNADLTAARTYTLPDASGTFAVSATGNIALSAAGQISFTGTLPVGSGGTGATSLTGILKGNGTSAMTAVTGTAGTVTYWSDANTIASNANFVWDNANARLGIGDASPAAALTVGNGDLFQVNSSGAIAAATSVTTTGNVTINPTGGIAGQLQLRNPANTFQTNITAGAQSANISYTLPTAAPTAGQVLSSDASGNMSWVTGLTSSNGWTTSGNSITSAWNGTSGERLGTTNNQPLVFVTNGIRRMQIGTDNNSFLAVDINGSAFGGLGVGVTSPGTRLHVKGTVRLESDGSASYIQLRTPAGAAAVMTYDLPANAPSVDGQVLSSTTAGAMSWITPLTATTGWSLSGNSITYSTGALGAAPGGQWLGTSNNQSLRLVTNGLTRVIVANDGEVSMGGTLSVTGDATMNSALSVSGSATVTGATLLNSGATVVGTITSQTIVASQDQIVIQPAGSIGFSRFAGTITNADLTAARTYTLPNASGTFAVSASGQIALSAAGDISLSGTLPVSVGGTGATTLASGVLLGNGTSAITSTTTSAGISGVITDETGSGSMVFATSPTITTLTVSSGGASITGGATITGNSSITGTLNLAGSSSPLQVNGSAGTAGQVLTSGGASGTPTWATFSSGWSLTGNSLSDPSTQFLGTTNAQPLVIRINNSERMRFTADGLVGIGTSSPSVALHVATQQSNTANVTEVFRIDNQTASTPLAGIGTSMTFATKTALNNTETGLVLQAVTTDVTANSEDFDFVVQTMTNGLLNEKMRILSTGNVTIQGEVTASAYFESSDLRLKDVIHRDGDVAYFRWKDGRDTNIHIGYLAQEVQTTHPDQVKADKDGMLSVNYIEMLVEKIRQLEKRIEELESKK